MEHTAENDAPTACPTCGADGVTACVGLDGADHGGRSPYFDAKATAALDSMARVAALADQWDETPDYTSSDYDQGRVDQRHDMTTQLLEALGDARDIPPGVSS